MTFEQMQAMIQEMLAVQRELQASQLRLTEWQDRLAERQDKFMEELETDRQERKARDENIDRRLEQLIGYSINRERDSLDIQEEILNLKRRVIALEGKVDQQ